MSHVLEPAASGRSRCRGCGGPIAKGELRLGERVPNPFADEGDATFWFHLACGAYKRPEPLLEALGSTSEKIDRRDWLAGEARTSIEHRRLPRIAGAELSPTGRARCRSCKEMIPKDAWRIRLTFFEDGRFNPSGFVHAGCAKEYFGTIEILDRLRYFSPELGEEELASLGGELRGAGS